MLNPFGQGACTTAVDKLLLEQICSNLYLPFPPCSLALYKLDITRHCAFICALGHSHYSRFSEAGIGAGTLQLNNRRLVYVFDRLLALQGLLGNRICWKSPNLND